MRYLAVLNARNGTLLFHSLTYIQLLMKVNCLLCICEVESFSLKIRMFEMQIYDRLHHKHCQFYFQAKKTFVSVM